MEGVVTDSLTSSIKYKTEYQNFMTFSAAGCGAITIVALLYMRLLSIGIEYYFIVSVVKTWPSIYL